ncbi:hypothetical protein ABID82_001617 [Methylobacterium sp. PvP062]|jgi:hypothetical protein|uniref:Uncharacterized protein n=2 Tax=Methylobacterium TaxID=407 RepID=A0A509EBN9_9HYPH|nr:MULTISPECIES: hypothetical protein [Methylobacterium]MCX7333357.1 hypothetical protein [Hyphomicrobiales bacterium]GAN46084.1 peptidase S9 prolyl oligopeptidase active site domain protein [Methylobacterium sp. ME121]MBN6818405.1 hypothetical protein [Methylobacterium organophilum]MBP2492821.1 hypothetical protein [Methylobacterium sp. PvP105]MBP2500807.1 hypothetical protein [Methylobacterium sp. PvP109]
MRMKISTLSEAQRVAHERDLGRRRKAGERERLRDMGRPDAATLDRALGDAVRSILSRGGDALTRPVTPAALLRLTQEHLLLRSVRAEEAGREPVRYRSEAVLAAIQDRLLTPPRGAPGPAKAA